MLSLVRIMFLKYLCTIILEHDFQVCLSSYTYYLGISSCNCYEVIDPLLNLVGFSQKQNEYYNMGDCVTYDTVVYKARMFLCASATYFLTSAMQL